MIRRICEDWVGAVGAGFLGRGRDSWEKVDAC